MLRVRLRLIPVVVGAAVLAALALSYPAAGPQQGVFIPHPDTETSPDTLTIQFAENIPRDRWNDILAAHGATLDHKMQLEGFAVISVPEDERAGIGGALAASGVIHHVEEITYRYPASVRDDAPPDSRLPAAVVPNDPMWDVQWNMRLITADDAWETSVGSGVKVAVVDTGVAYENFGQFTLAPDLAGTPFVDPYDFFDDDTHANDDHGHGTHVTGTIAQRTGNVYGVAGVAHEATIMPVKVCGYDGPGYQCPTSAIADGITWAANHGARVINMSLSAPGSVTQAERTAIEFARNAGVVIVAAAGNGGADGIGDPALEYPAAVAAVISVAASGYFGEKMSYSSYGAGEGGQNLDVIAPGGYSPDINEQTAVTQETYSFYCNGGPKDFGVMAFCPDSGTSMAAAHVSGLAALIRSAYPNLNRTQIRNLIQCSAVYVGQSGLDPDFQTGHGLVQSHAALRDTDGDKLPDCIDTSPFTPTVTGSPSPTPTKFPTPFPPPNECLATPTPTPTPSPSPSPSPSPTREPTPTPTATPVEAAGVSLSDTPTPTETTSPTDTPTDSPTDTDPPATETDTPTPSGSESPTDTGSPSESDTATPTPTATATPDPASLTPTPSATPYVMCGDVNCDQTVNGMDALEIMRFMAFVPGTASCIGKGFVNCDGAVDQLDALVILRHVAEVPLGIPQGCHGIG
ncbi:MAG TPA: S8 family serine peptidase [Dehalococcoidia bacterium]|nr:S8 family serine peptidase [Dehalococcoidia bacterium]